MDLKAILKSSWTRLIFTSILLIVITNIVSYLLSLRIPYTERTPTSSNVEIIGFILAGMFIVALLNKANNIKISIITGVKIGILAGILYFTYLFTYSLILQALNPEIYYEGSGIIFAIVAFFTVFWLISSISGMLISYFTRKFIAKRKFLSD